MAIINNNKISTKFIYKMITSLGSDIPKIT